MDYSRRQFLKLAAAGLPVAAAAPLLLHDEVAHAAPAPPPKKAQGPGRGVRVLEVTEPYDQDEAAAIHKRWVERQIRKAGEVPEKVKERAERRIRELKPR